AKRWLGTLALAYSAFNAAYVGAGDGFGNSVCVSSISSRAVGSNFSSPSETSVASGTLLKTSGATCTRELMTFPHGGMKFSSPGVGSISHERMARTFKMFSVEQNLCASLKSIETL